MTLLNIKNIDFNNIDERLQHLSEQQIIEIINRYYEGEKVNNLLKEYKINTSSSNLIRILPSVLDNEKCKYCEKRFVIPLSSRTYGNIIDEYYKKCPNCNHQPNINFCNCLNCEEKRRKEELARLEKEAKIEEQKRKYLNQILSEDNWVKKEENELEFEDRLYLAVVLRAALSENMMYTEPLKEYSGLLAPTEEFESEIIKTLTARGILVPHKISNFNSFRIEFKDEEMQSAKVSHNIYDVFYRINIEPSDMNYNEMIKRLMYPSPELFSKEFCYEMWKKIAYHESLQYLLFQMNEVGYSFNSGEKTKTVLENLIESFSVAQVYNIIYRAVANSTARYQSGKITKIHAQNSVITSCEIQGEKALAENWNLKGYNRIRELPETLISKVLYNSIMKISELGFHEKPTLEY